MVRVHPLRAILKLWDISAADSVAHNHEVGAFDSTSRYHCFKRRIVGQLRSVTTAANAEVAPYGAGAVCKTAVNAFRGSIPGLGTIYGEVKANR